MNQTFNTVYFMKKNLKKAFTLVETLIVAAVLAIIITIAVPAILSSRQNAEYRTADANAKLLNDGITRATLEGDTDPVLSGSNVEALALYLVAENYVQAK